MYCPDGEFRVRFQRCSAIVFKAVRNARQQAGNTTPGGPDGAGQASPIFRLVRNFLRQVQTDPAFLAGPYSRPLAAVLGANRTLNGA
jgi:hypothetical protein